MHLSFVFVQTAEPHQKTLGGTGRQPFQGQTPSHLAKRLLYVSQGSYLNVVALAALCPDHTPAALAALRRFGLPTIHLVLDQAQTCKQCCSV